MRVMNVGTPLTSCIFHPTDPDLLMLADTKNKVQSLSLSSATFRESIEFNDRIKVRCPLSLVDDSLAGSAACSCFRSVSVSVSVGAVSISRCCRLHVSLPRATCASSGTSKAASSSTSTLPPQASK